MEQSNQSKKVLLSVIGVAILVVAVVGVSFAFFNYTRTGGEQRIETGSIYFTSSQSEAISVTNFFPASREEAVADGRRSSQMTVSIEGGTTYDNGIDFTITAVGIQRAAAVQNIPVVVTTSGTGDTGFTFTGINETEVPTTGTLALGSGNIAKQANGGRLVNSSRVVTHGTVTITAYIPSNVAITDTYNAGGEPTNDLGTTSDWVNGRRVVTTDQWNSLAENPVRFSVKVEANEGATAPVTP